MTSTVYGASIHGPHNAACQKRGLFTLQRNTRLKHRRGIETTLEMLVLQFSLTLSHTESNALTLTVKYADASQIGIGTDLYVI